MQNNFNFKNIPISFKKLYKYSKILSNKPIIYYNNFFFSNKINFILRKITNIIINNTNKDVFIKNFNIGKGKVIKKINFRAKGKINFTLKRFTNINIKILYGKKD